MTRRWRMLLGAVPLTAISYASADQAFNYCRDQQPGNLVACMSEQLRALDLPTRQDPVNLPRPPWEVGETAPFVIQQQRESGRVGFGCAFGTATLCVSPNTDWLIPIGTQVWPVSVSSDNELSWGEAFQLGPGGNTPVPYRREPLTSKSNNRKP